MTCRMLRELLEAEPGDPQVADPALAAQRAAHLATCPACAAEKRSRAVLREALLEWKDAAAPDRLADRALARCATAPASGGRRRRGLPLAWTSLVPVLAVSAAAGWFWFGAGGNHQAAEAPRPLTADEHYALEALGTAADRVARAQDFSLGALERVLALTSEHQEHQEPQEER
jgi:hypothetical protein